MNPIKILDTFKISSLAFLLLVFGILLWFAASLFPASFYPAFRWISLLAPVFLPIILVPVLWELWLTYIRAKYIHRQEYVLLEILLPREISKSPLAMEAMLANLHIGSGEGTFIMRYIKGQVRPSFSLEIASIEGRVSVFIWTRKFLKDVVEAQIYGQYPMVEVRQVEDYAKKFHYNKETHVLWGCDFILNKPDPYPIKTYVDYGLDKDPKEEFKIDPMGGFFEFLGKIGPGEQVWFQLIIRANKGDLREDRVHVPGALFGTTTNWKEQAQKEIEEIRKKATPERPGSEYPAFPQPTPGQTETIKAIERSISKPGFDAGIRAIYIAQKDRFNAANIGALTMSLRQLGDNNLNSFRPYGWLTTFDYPWQDFRDRRKEKMRQQIVDAYRRRSYFYPPYKGKRFILNTEEIATIFHFPGAAVQAPALSRIPSRKGEPPSNLPV